MEKYETIKKLLVHYLKSSFLPARIASLHGLLYIIQGCLLSNTIIAGISEEMQLFLPVAVEYAQCHLNIHNRYVTTLTVFFTCDFHDLLYTVI